ncbi:MAG: SufE family protein [Verrucomicrobiota bacterium]
MTETSTENTDRSGRDAASTVEAASSRFLRCNAKKNMLPEQRQTQLIARYSIIPDPQERLASLVNRRSTLLPLEPEERTDALLVPGCVSKVWLAASLENGRCRFRLHAESVLVKGLLSVLCEMYDGASPAEIIAVEPELFEALGIARNLSPTRLNGIARVRERILSITHDFSGRFFSAEGATPFQPRVERSEAPG